MEKAPVMEAINPDDAPDTLANDIGKESQSLHIGLTQAEAEARLQQQGYNELVEERVNPLKKFLTYFWGPIPWMIEVAALLSLAVRHWPDFGIIMALLIFNAVVGFWEEYQADHEIAALKRNWL